MDAEFGYIQETDPHVRRRIAQKDVMTNRFERLDSHVKRGPDGIEPEWIFAIKSKSAGVHPFQLRMNFLPVILTIVQ